MQPWDKYLSEQDRRVYTQAGFGQRGGIGERPALVIIDVTYGFTGEPPQPGALPEPIEASIRRYATSCGPVSWPAVRANQQLLAAARSQGIPIFYTLTEWRADGADVGGWQLKSTFVTNPAMHEGERGAQIVEELQPISGEIVISKKKPSAFFGTPLAAYLIERKIDTLLITGCTTSGCVRASVIDAFSYNFRVIVPQECVFDRGEASHAINLFDMQQKYADVLPVDEVIAGLKRPKVKEEAAECNIPSL